MKIKILINIKKKNKIMDFYLDGNKEYEKRLSRFCKIENVYFKDEKDLSKHLKEGQKVFVLSKKAKSLSSEEFSQLIGKLSLESNVYSDIVFVLADFDLEGEAFTISSAPLSKEMEHLILLEQIYRGYKILNNESYHK